MSNASRKSRGAETQRLVAAYWRDHGWPFCTDAGAGRNGADLINTPGLRPEIKAVRGFSIPSWLRQASQHPGPGLALVVQRPDGFGPATIGDWPMIFRQEDGIILLRQAGYGDPLDYDGPLVLPEG
jgi:hypothetical protein